MAALYQRARPATFAEVVGQEHVKEVLASSLLKGRTGHAYLFSGPRGVGKTTTARLLAMAVNCEVPDLAARPCGVCESCRLVRSGSHPDVTELDAASNNSVDDVRELKERVVLASLRGGTRVWILDEAHMLSKAAANALLKTLEEPPPGLLFVLATTEPEKLPATVLSRCQHFRFRRLTEGEIQGKLVRLCDEAGVAFQPEALALVARAADGGMRDAESLLERLLVSGEQITAAAAEDALGLPPGERLLAMAKALAASALAELLDLAGELYRAGFSPRTVVEQLSRGLRDLLHAKLTGDDRLGVDQDGLLRLLHALDDEVERFTRRNDLYGLEVALIKANNALSHNTPWQVAQPASAATAAGTAPAARMAPAAPSQASASPIAAATPAAPKPRAPAAGRTAAEPRATPAANAAPAEAAGAGAVRAESSQAESSQAESAQEVSAGGGHAEAGSGKPAPSTSPSSGGARPFSWHAVKSAAGPQLKAFLMPAQASNEGSELHLTFEERHKFHFTQVLERQAELEALIASVAGAGFKLHLHGPGARAGGRKKSLRGSAAPAGAATPPTPAPAPSSRGQAAEPAWAVAAPPAADETVADQPIPASPIADQPIRASPIADQPVSTSPIADLTVAAPPVAVRTASQPVDDTPTTLYGELPVDFWGDTTSLGEPQPEADATSRPPRPKAERAVAPAVESVEEPVVEPDTTDAGLAVAMDLAMAELRELFPGKVVELIPRPGDEAASRATTEEFPASVAGEEGTFDPDGDAGYDDDSQDRLRFGPVPADRPN